MLRTTFLRQISFFYIKFPSMFCFKFDTNLAPTPWTTCTCDGVYMLPLIMCQSLMFQVTNEHLHKFFSGILRIAFCFISFQWLLPNLVITVPVKKINENENKIVIEPDCTPLYRKNNIKSFQTSVISLLFNIINIIKEVKVKKW